VGFDRTPSGSNAVGQYRAPLSERWAEPKTTPEHLLLWFHRVPWDHRLKDGSTLWDGIVAHYTRGAERAKQFVARWEALKGRVDDERHAAVAAKLALQAADAQAWRVKCLSYFAQFSGRPW
jgi:alpha-glucuronidase